MTALNSMRVLRDIPNLDGASCKDVDDKEFFFPSDHQLPHRLEELRNFCGSCPVVRECLKYALDNTINDGFWGGTTPKERRRLLRSRKPVTRLERASKMQARGAQILEFRSRGASYQEIAEHLGISTDAAIQTVVRYRRKMKVAQQ